jgi:6-phosphogluconate dehydrogenase
VWSNTEADELHVPAPTLNVAHAFRLASAYLGDRESAKNVLGGGWPPQKIVLDAEQKAVFIEDLRKPTVATCLASYTQGLIDIQAANKKHNWEIHYAAILQIWKSGCIIQADTSPKCSSPLSKPPQAPNPSTSSSTSELCKTSETASPACLK